MDDYKTSGLTSFSAIGVISVTPSDTVDLTKFARAIRANAAGTIKITCYDESFATLNFLAGETRAICARRIWATGTTATGIEGMY